MRRLAPVVVAFEYYRDATVPAAQRRPEDRHVMPCSCVMIDDDVDDHLSVLKLDVVVSI